MKLFTYESSNGMPHVGVVLADGTTVDVTSMCEKGRIKALNGKVPADAQDFIDSQGAGDEAMRELATMDANALVAFRVDVHAVRLSAPIPRPR